MRILPFFILSILCFGLVGCTYNVSLAHTEGTATDVVDTNQTARAKVDPNFNVPIHSESPINITPAPKETTK